MRLNLDTNDSNMSAKLSSIDKFRITLESIWVWENNLCRVLSNQKASFATIAKDEGINLTF